MRDNKGYNLIEFVVVIAIMVIIVTSVTLSVTTAIGWKAKQCAIAIDDKLDETKTNALGKDSYELQLRYDASKGFVAESSIFYYDVSGGTKVLKTVPESSSIETVGDANLTVKAYVGTGSGATPTEIDIKTNKLTISFDRSSGSFLPVKRNDDATYLTDGSGNYLYLEKITVTAKNGKSYTIECVKLTGKHYIE